MRDPEQCHSDRRVFGLFDGFSIGSNDLTQLTLGVDRDSDIVAFDFDERDPGMLEMFRQAVVGAKRNGRHVGICGEAPANYPEIARYLTELGINSISVNPASVFRTMAVVARGRSQSGQHQGVMAANWPGPAFARICSAAAFTLVIVSVSSV